MFHTEDQRVKSLILKARFGLERENLRIDNDGFLSHTLHPFPNDEHIVRDFCENQTEINTPVCESAEEAVKSLSQYDRLLQRRLGSIGEMLWQFSNPPYIRDENDIPIARFSGIDTGKTAYREYLAQRYGRYKMSLSGIHVNFSFDEELMKADFELSTESDYRTYKNDVYLRLARRMVSYGWILTAVTAASPIADSSFSEKGKIGEDTFYGMASLRCSEIGYWNYFTPILDYTDVKAYAESINKYVANGLIHAPSELYYPIRLKPPGINTLAGLEKYGINHIELRMFDLDPFAPAGVDLRDVEFAHLLMVWLASAPDLKLDGTDQINAVQNFKNAAHYDLKTVHIITSDGESRSVVHTAIDVIGEMRKFYNNIFKDAEKFENKKFENKKFENKKFDKIKEILDFEENKFTDPNTRYAWRIRQEFGSGFVEKGLELAEKRQREATENV